MATRFCLGCDYSRYRSVTMMIVTVRVQMSDLEFAL